MRPSISTKSCQSVLPFFFSRFICVWLQSKQKVPNFSNKFIQERRIWWILDPLKSCKIMHGKKFTNFLGHLFCHFFNRFEIRSNLNFVTPFSCFAQKNVVLILALLQTFKPNAYKTAKETKSIFYQCDWEFCILHPFLTIWEAPICQKSENGCSVMDCTYCMHSLCCWFSLAKSLSFSSSMFHIVPLKNFPPPPPSLSKETLLTYREYIGRGRVFLAVVLVHSIPPPPHSLQRAGYTCHTERWDCREGCRDTQTSIGKLAI